MPNITTNHAITYTNSRYTFDILDNLERGVSNDGVHLPVSVKL